jgi:hypothetical protein
LTNGEKQQLGLHVDALAILFRANAEGATVAASKVANDCLLYFEEGAGGFPGTGRDINSHGNDTLSTPEINQLASEVNSMTALIEHDGALAADTANEMLGLFEQRALNTLETGRDVKQDQLP